MRFPKVHSPFEREEDENGNYTVIDSINEELSWVFKEDDVIAIEKLHGTNCCVRIKQTETGKEIEGFTRHGYEPMQRADPYSSMTEHHDVVRAIQNSLRRGYLDNLGEDVHYGEVVGPDFHENVHELDENLFIPFSWLADKCSYKSWGKYPKTFESLEQWFENDLFSLFYSRMHGKDLNASSVSNGTFCEGIIFAREDEKFTEKSLVIEEEHMSGGQYRKYTPQLAKLRRDMFTDYQSGIWPMTEYGNH